MTQQGTEEPPAGQGNTSAKQRTEGAPEEQATEQATELSAPSEQSTEKQSAPSEQPTQKQQSSPSEQPTGKQQTQQPQAQQPQAQQPQRGQADTSWADPEQQPHRRSVDVGELVWRTGNVLATVLRALALLFALVLIVNLVLVLVGVNPTNGVAQFVGGVAAVAIIGFRDLFVPSNPTVGLIVNSLVAAAFWVFVGELVSRVIRFLAARVK